MSGFKKRTQQKSIPGTRTSLQNGQLITSTGNPSLDHIIGGGLPIGSLILIEEDKFVTYSKVLAKYFLAEGIFSGQSVFIGSLDDDPLELVKKLPKPVESSTPNIEESQNLAQLRNHISNEDNEEMRIAWRYNSFPAVNSEQSTANIGHHFNLTEQIDEGTLKTADITYWSYSVEDVNVSEYDNKMFFNHVYLNLLENLSNTLKCAKFQSGECEDNKQVEHQQKSLQRICLTCLGSPLWHQEHFSKDFIKFLTILKSIVRCFNAVCFLTVPIHLINVLDGNLVPRIRNLVDFSIEMESFAGSEKEMNPAFKEYHGLLNIRKMAALNSLAAFTPETTDLAFKLRRKKFVIEKLHLPPELQEPDQTQLDDIVPSLSCGSSQKNLLEF